MSTLIPILFPISNALLLFGIQVAEQDHKLRDARIQLEEYERKTKVQLEHRNLVSQQLEHTIVRGLHILLLHMNFGAKPTAACIRDCIRVDCNCYDDDDAMLY